MIFKSRNNTEEGKILVSLKTVIKRSIVGESCIFKERPDDL